ncbi:AraC family transcriptional regulator [Methylobacterium nonmethylotrophicum]|uniref:AraC family transcriptional regulator n=1 Tax=Methylobacterium nonmethylotrophicum TaxID=1141884 RepID=A0A4Z0NJY4_9HYPH|nr:AraC family transcriptional regulator [Methylobacterium nonmethylotrophicum]TGD96639.1 AraC family transcriptional regulator [Methylobacterium nonmethylotrophicum]
MPAKIPSRNDSSIDLILTSNILVKTRNAIPIDFFNTYAIRAIYEILSENGHDPDDIFERAGVDSNIFITSEVTSLASLGRLTALAASQTQCAHFGLLVGRRTTLASLGLLGSLLRHSETIGDALHALKSHYDHLNRGALLEVTSDDAVATVRYSPYDAETDGIALHCERAVATLTNVLRALCGPNWSPDEVWLPRLEPPDIDPYRKFFRCSVRFEQEIAALVFAARVLRQPIAGAKPVIRNAVERRIRQLEADVPSDTSGQVRRQVRSTVAEKRVQKSQIAQLLAIGHRTLSRRLKAEGTTFRSVASQTRLGTAKQLLSHTNLSLAEISAALEFSEPAAFTHAFRRWTGTTPSAWRRNRHCT